MSHRAARQPTGVQGLTTQRPEAHLATKSGPSCGGHSSSGHRASTGGIERHLPSSASTWLIGAANGLQRGQQSAVQVPSMQFASDAHSAFALAGVSDS